MKIIADYPPNFEAIKKVFPDCEKLKAVFAYGNTIYNPNGSKIDKYMLAHESTHQVQQGNDVEGWWTQYLNDPQFRIVQELEAYHVQYLAAVQDGRSQSELRRYAHAMAEVCAGPLYGNVISFGKALDAILQ